MRDSEQKRRQLATFRHRGELVRLAKEWHVPFLPQPLPSLSTVAKMARYGQESQKEGGGGGSGCGDTGGGGVGAGGDAARRGGMSGGRESGGEGGAGKEEEKGGVGSGEESIHRAFVWDWGFCKGVAMYTVEVETLGEGGEVRRVFRRSERATFVKKATSFFDYVTMPSAAERNDNAFDRYTDFRELWEAVSSTHPTIKGFHFPAKEAVFSSRSFFTTGLSSENIEEARRRKFNDLLLLLVDLKPRPPELLAFLSPRLSEGSPKRNRTPGVLRLSTGERVVSPNRGCSGGDGGGGRGGGGGGGRGGGGGGKVGAESRAGREGEGEAPERQVEDGVSSRRQRQSQQTPESRDVGAAQRQEAIPLPDTLELRVLGVCTAAFQACLALHALGAASMLMVVLLTLEIASVFAAGVSLSARWASVLQASSELGQSYGGGWSAWTENGARRS
eukprot:jgi/Undpi1/4935/HiC_scaffold_19.g08287.m1